MYQVSSGHTFSGTPMYLGQDYTHEGGSSYVLDDRQRCIDDALIGREIRAKKFEQNTDRIWNISVALFIITCMCASASAICYCLSVPNQVINITAVGLFAATLCAACITYYRCPKLQ